MIDHATITVWLVDDQSRTKLIANLLEFKLEQQVNRHARVCLKGVTDSRDQEIASEAKIEIKQQDEVIFRGKIVTYQISVKSQYWELELEAVATTCEMDLEVKRRTFQNEKMTYADFVKKILAEYPGAQCDIPSDYGKKTIDQFYLQFDETDWQQLIRLASALNLALISDPTSEKPKLYFGLPSASTNLKPVPKTAVYHLVKDWAAYRLVTENSLLTQASEPDYEIYQVEETGDLLNVGDPVNYHGDDRLVYQVTVTKSGSELTQECLLAKAGGFQQSKIYNEELRGLTIKGTVVERSVGQDQEPPVAVKVRFTIDKVYESKHKTENAGIYHWFPYAPFYAAEGSTGLYCLPEVGEQVALYFPGCKEEEAFVTNSYRLPNRVTITDPNIKCLQTAFGKKIVFTENGIKIVGKEGTGGTKDLVYIELESDGNLTIHSDSKVSFQAAQTLDAHAKGKVDITADDYIYLCGNGCSIRMTGGNDFKGLKVLQKQGKEEKKTKVKVKAGSGGAIGGETVLKNSVKNITPTSVTKKEDAAKEDNWKFDYDPLDNMKIRRNSKSNTFGMVRKKYNKELKKYVDKPHQGVDLYANIGTKTHAVCDGKIVIKDEKGDYGKQVEILFSKNGKQYYAFYAHLSNLFVKVGDQVKAGQVIGKTGDTGNANDLEGEDLHLHFEIRTTERPGTGLPGRIDPLPFFNKKMEVK